MADSDRLSSSLQESILSALAWFGKEAAAIASVVSPELFEGEYRDIAERVLEYRQRFGVPPGDGHIDDLFDHILSDPTNRKYQLYRRLLIGIRELSQHLNIEYVTTRVQEFVRRQRYKIGVLAAAERYQQGGDDVADDVERILLDTVKQQTDAIDPGTFFNDVDRVFSWTDQPDNEAFPTGIKELDQYGACPKRKELLLFIGPKGSGKSWFEIFVGKMAILTRQQLNVCHISLENSEDVTKQRYLQAFWAVARRGEWVMRTGIETNEVGQLVDLPSVRTKPKLTFEDPQALRRALVPKMEKLSGLKHLVVKGFPTASLTVPKLESYLDYLEAQTGFVPDVLLIDYPDLMAIPQKDFRLSLGRIYVELRGVAVRRNCAVVAPTQSNREGIKSSRTSGVHVAEDISKIFTADTVLTYSQPSTEHKFGLARIFVNNSRGDRDKYTVLVSQSYATGQFSLQSAMMGPKYDDLLANRNGQPLPDDPPDDLEAEGD